MHATSPDMATSSRDRQKVFNVDVMASCLSAEPILSRSTDPANSVSANCSDDQKAKDQQSPCSLLLKPCKRINVHHLIRFELLNTPHPSNALAPSHSMIASGGG